MLPCLSGQAKKIPLYYTLAMYALLHQTFNISHFWVTPDRAVALQVFDFGQRSRMASEGDTNAR